MSEFDEDEVQLATDINEQIIKCGKDFEHQLRQLLGVVQERKTYQVLDFNSLEEYLSHIAKKTELTVKHLRRIAHAGCLEAKLLGADKVGNMSGASLRVLSENVAPECQIKVFKKAMKRLKSEKLPTAKQISKAAKELNAYKKRERIKPTNANSNVVSIEDARRSKRAKTDQPGSELTDKLPSPAVKGKALLRQYGADDALILACMLDGAQDESLYTEFKKILKEYPDDQLHKIVHSIDAAIDKQKPKKKPKIRS